MKFRSVKTKTLVFMLPLILLTLITIVSASFAFERNIINDQTSRNLNEQLMRTASEIQVKLTAHEKLAEILAASAGYRYNELSREQYSMLISQILKTNGDSFGIGMAFEPYVFDKKDKYYATYAYKEGQKIVTTEAYSDPSYDYFNQEYYRIAADSLKLGYTDPYYDEGTKTTMVTTIVPVFDSHNRFVAVSNADINLTTIQKMISGIQVGSKGWAYLIDKKGTYLAGPDTDKIMKTKLQQDSDPDMASMGTTLLKQKSGTTAYKSPNGMARVQYVSMPNTQWILAIAIPEAELSAPLNSLVVKLATIGLIGVLFIIVLILLYARNITHHINRVKRVSLGLSLGDLTQSIVVTTRDEFGQMADGFNQTIRQLKGVISGIVSHTLTLSSASEQVTSSVRQSQEAAALVSERSRSTALGAETQLQGPRKARLRWRSCPQGSNGSPGPLPPSSRSPKRHPVKPPQVTA